MTRGGSRQAFELKFLIDECQARQVEDWARQRLAPDPHGDSALGGAYLTTSIYCDTPTLCVFHAEPSYRRRKFRIRRYGSASWVFVERKSREDDRVSKRRTSLPLNEVPLLSESMALVSSQAYWFHRRLLRLDLGPACRVTYERTAFVASGGSPRLTLDRRIRGMLASDWNLAPAEPSVPLLNGRVILEFKFAAALPVIFKKLAADLRLTPVRVSKYRLCRAAWGTAVGETARA